MTLRRRRSWLACLLLSLASPVGESAPRTPADAPSTPSAGRALASEDEPCLVLRSGLASSRNPPLVCSALAHGSASLEAGSGCTARQVECEANPVSAPAGGDGGGACARTANTTSVQCIDGACAVTSCRGGFGDCDGLYANGCEIDLFSSVQQCGGCEQPPCPIPTNAQSAACTRPLGCGIGRCLPGFADCNHLVTDGCERRIDSDVANCGACGVACPAYPQTEPDCGAGACGFDCTGEFYDVDGEAANGCETEDSPTGNHSLAQARNEGVVTGCDKGAFTEQIIGHIPSDRHRHPALPIRSNHTVEDWYAITPQAEGCEPDLDFRFITSGGTRSGQCFQATFFTNQNSYSLQTTGSGVVTLGPKSNAYTTPSTIYVKVEKLTDEPGCDAARNEDVLYIINYHL